MGHRYSIDLQPNVWQPQQTLIAIGMGVLTWGILAAARSTLQENFPSLPLSQTQLILAAVAVAVLTDLILYRQRVVSYLKSMTPQWTNQQISSGKLVGNPHYIIHAFRYGFATLADRAPIRILIPAGVGFLVSACGILLFVTSRRIPAQPPVLRDWLTLMIPMGEFLTIVFACVATSLSVRSRIGRAEITVVGYIESFYTTGAVASLEDGAAFTAQTLAEEQRATVLDQRQTASPSTASNDQFGRDLFGRDLFGRDPFGRDPFGRDPFGPALGSSTGSDLFSGTASGSSTGASVDPFAPTGSDPSNSNNKDPFSG